MIVNFATICDHAYCSTRSPENTAWPSCMVCHRHTCPAHTTPGTLHADDGDGLDTVICLKCTALAAAEKQARESGRSVYVVMGGGVWCFEERFPAGIPCYMVSPTGETRFIAGPAPRTTFGPGTWTGD